MSDSAKNILTELLRSGRHSRAALAKKLKLSRPAISAAVDKLLSKNLVREAGTGESSGGKPPIMLELVSAEFCAIGLDIGDESYIRGIMMDGNSNILDEESIKFENKFDSICDSLREIIETLRRRSPTRKICGVGVAVPGVVDTKKSTILFSAHFDISGKDLANHLTEITGLPVQVWNRARAAAMAEWKNGAAANDNCFVYISFDYGIGAVIHHNGHMLNGNNFSAGEIREIMIPHELDGVMKLQPLELVMREIFSQNGAIGYRECYSEYLMPCVHLVTLLSAIVDPDTVVFGGKFKALGNDFLAELATLIQEGTPGRLHQAALQYSQAGILGSACGAAFKMLQQYVEFIDIEDI